MPASFNPIDLACLLLIALSLCLGLWRGLVYEVFGLIGWIVAFFVAQHFADALALQLPRFFALQDWGRPMHYALAFILIFVAVLLSSALLAWLAKSLIAAVGLKPVDRVLGGVFGLLRAALILLVLTAAVLMTPLAHDSHWRTARAAQPLEFTLGELKPLLPAKMQGYLPAAR